MRLLASLAAVIAMMPAAAFAQAATPPADEPSWEFTLSGTTYFVADDSDFLQPTVAVDRGRLHLEARYNYEAFDTGSMWAGYNFSGGETVTWEFTPMLGAVFGATDGIAPGYKGSLGWKMLEFY